MKVFASSLIAAAMAATVANAATCDTASVTALLTSDEVTSCASDSGYSPSSLKTPTEAEMTIMCSDTACQTVLSDLTTMFPEECTVGTFALYSDLITPVTAHCSSSTSSSSTAASASTSASSTSAAATSTSASSTGSDSVATSASSASLGSAAEVTAAPANTTSSASSNDDVTVGDSSSGSLAIETQTPATEAPSSSTTADSAASASSAADDTSSGSSAGVAVSPSAALLGSALVATAALFL